MSLSRKSVIVREGLLGATIWLLITTQKINPRGTMSNGIKNLSVSSSLPITFEVKWHNSWSNKWYQNQGHGFKLQECYCVGGIVMGTTIWLSTTTLKVGLWSAISNAIKYLSVSFSSSIGFEVERYNSWFDKSV